MHTLSVLLLWVCSADGKRAFLDVVFMESDVWLYWKSCPRQQVRDLH